MERPARGSGIPQPASAGGTLLAPSSPPLASAGGDTANVGQDNQTYDVSKLQHFASHAAGDAPDTLQARSATPGQPGTSRDGSGDVHSENPSPNNPWLQPIASEMEVPAEMLVASPSCSHLESKDSRQQPAADDQPGTSVSPRTIRHSEETIRYLGQGAMNLTSRSEGGSLENCMGNSTHDLARRTTESGVHESDVFPCSGGARLDRVALITTEGSLLGSSTLIPRAFLRCGSVRNLKNVRISVTQGAQHIATSSSSTSIATGGSRIAPPGGYFHNHQDHGSSLQCSQRPQTYAAISSFVRQTAIQQDSLRAASQQLSLGRSRELRENGGAVGGLPPPSSQGAAQGSTLPSTSSSGWSSTPIEEPTREAHGWPHFGAPLPDTLLPASSFGQQRPPFSPPPHLDQRWAPFRRMPPPTSLQERQAMPGAAGSLFPPYPPQMASLEPSQAEDDHPPDILHEAFRRILRRGLRQSDIDKLPSYPFKPEQHGQIFCSVCSSEMESQETVRVLPCKHQFHATCVDKWLGKNRTCPNCRQDASAAAPFPP